MIAARTDYSHTTVAKAFTPAAASMAWPVLAQICGAVGADAGEAFGLWSPDRAGQLPVAANQLSPVPGPTLIVWCGVLLTGGVGIAVMQTVVTDVSATTFITDLVQALFALTATVTFAWRARRSHLCGDSRSTRYFAALSTGIEFWALGQIAWFVARNVEHQPLPRGHLHDVGYLLMPVGVDVASRAVCRYALLTSRVKCETDAVRVVASGKGGLVREVVCGDGLDTSDW